MQRFLLINNNKAVSKLVETSFKQLGFELTQISDYHDLVLDGYLAIIIDSQMYDQSYIEDLGALSSLPSLIYIKKIDEFSPQGIKYFIQKPFLPTDFIAFMTNIINENEELKHLRAKLKNNIFDLPQNSNYRTNEILKDDDIQEIKDIFDDDMFSANQDIEEISSFKNYEDIEESLHDNEIFNLNDLSEYAIQNVLNEHEPITSSTQKTSFEVVKNELQHTIEHSVATLAMQSQILRETLKGLKMNITITFEDR